MDTASQSQGGIPGCLLRWALSRDMLSSRGDLWHKQSDLKGCCNVCPPRLQSWLRSTVGHAVARTWVSPRSQHLTLLFLAGIDVAHLCRNSGLCVDTGNTHFCRCQAGYTGSYCEEQVDECSPNPCQNGATCTDYLGGYSCEVGAAGRQRRTGRKQLPKELPQFRAARCPCPEVGAGLLTSPAAGWELREPL